jgi:hypothetical protein
MSISLVHAGIRVAGQNQLSGFSPSCALWLREMYFFRNGACAPGSWAATEDSPPRIREDSRGFAGQNLLSGFPPPCALWLRERMSFFVTAPARLDLGLPRRTALQGFAGICVHSRAKFSGLLSQISGFFSLCRSAPWNRFEPRIPPNQNLFCKGHDAGGTNLYG